MVLLRLVLGAIFLAHGIPKLNFISGFGGMLANMGVPAAPVAAVLIIGAEIIGGVALILGLGTRVVALILALEMVVTTFVIKWPMLGFVAPPNQGAGAELDLLMLVALLALVACGAGALAADGLIGRRFALRSER